MCLYTYYEYYVTAHIVSNQISESFQINEVRVCNYQINSAQSTPIYVFFGIFTKPYIFTQNKNWQAQETTIEFGNRIYSLKTQSHPSVINSK